MDAADIVNTLFDSGEAMSFISTLAEASDTPIEDLKKILNKDKRVKGVLSSMPFDEIPNVAEFLSTMKYHVLNNRHVLEFVKSRADVNELSPRILKSVREVLPKDFNEGKYEALQEFLKALFKEYGSVDRMTLSSYARKELSAWINQSGRYYQLSSSTQRELLSIPSLRPTEPVVVYRGLLFSSSDLKERKRYDGSMEIGKGLKFLRAVRDGKRIVDLEWDRPSSWTTSTQTAMQFARFGPANSSFGATLNWLSRKGAIDGDLGFIVSHRVQPEDVLIDTSKIHVNSKYAAESELILKPGTYVCRVHTKYTKDGEVDLSKPVQELTWIPELMKAFDEFQTRYDLSEFEDLKAKGWDRLDLELVLRSKDVQLLNRVTSSEVRTKLEQRYNEAKEFYTEHLSKRTVAELNEAGANEANTKRIQTMLYLKSSMESEKNHADFRTGTNAKGRVKQVEMTAKQVRDTGSHWLPRTIAKFSTARFTDSTVSRELKQVGEFFGVSVDSDLHRKGVKIQQEEFQKILKAAKKVLSLNGDTVQEQQNALANRLLSAARNIVLLTTLREYELQND